MDVLKLMLRSPFILIKGIVWIISKIFLLLGIILRPLLGNIQWRAPAWLSKSSKLAKNGFSRLEKSVDNHPKKIAGSLLALVALGIGVLFGYHYYLNRPQPIEPAPLVFKETSVRISNPDAVDYDSQTIVPKKVFLKFEGSVAPVTEEGKVVTKGITLTPATEGEWKWDNGWSLVFSPKKPLPMGSDYKVTLDPASLLAPQIILTKKDYSFSTPSFDYQIDEGEYYQDPQNPQKRSAIFPVRFNAPVDVASFEKQLALYLSEGKNGAEKKINFSVVYDEKKLNAWVHSEPLKSLDHGGTIHLTIGESVKASIPSKATTSAKNGWVAVPNRFSLAVKDIASTVVDTSDNKSERALIITMSDAVKDKELNQAVKAWLLPAKNPKYSDDNYSWILSDINSSLIAQSQLIALTANDAEQEYQPLFSFKFTAPALRYMLVEITNSMTSFGGYKMPEKVYKVIEVPEYPKTLSFMSEGSLLSVRGDKQISVAARNVPGLKLDIKRVIPSQLQHIVSFKSKNYSSAGFNQLNADYFSEHFEYKTAINNQKPGEISYQGIDLSRYLSSDPSSHRGVFLLTLASWDPEQKEPATDVNSGEESDEERDYDDGDNVGDSRFVVVTDLGIIAKRSQNNSRDVFIQSIQSGHPVSGAKVTVIGKNGTVLLSQTSSEDGHVRFASLETFKNEREPVMFLVEKEGDVSFLPTSEYTDRGLDLSRFDIGGEETPTDPRSLSSYLFSDRGVYRPGDTFNIGLITRTAVWGNNLQGIPLRAEIRDPRDTLMSTQPLTLNASGFNELSYTTSESSPTGEWNIYLYLPGKDEESSMLLGHTMVNVKEFEPDQLKVQLKLTPDNQQGWVKPSELAASINVQNLFGTPAQNRRVTSKLTLRPIYPSFTQLPDYQFYENRTNSDGFETDLEEQTTDNEGNAAIALNLKSYDDATWQLSLLSEAFNSGSGRSVAATARVLVSPYDYLVGIKTDGSLSYISKDAERHLNLIAVNPKLEKIELPSLTLELIEQKYISVLTKQDSGVYKYQSKMREVPISQQPLSLSAKNNDLLLATDRPGDFVLQIKNQQGQVLNRVSYSVAGNANLSRSLDRDAELKLKLNQQEYAPGDEIEVSINAPYTGSGLITIEKDKVYSWQWFKTSTTSSVQKIRLPQGIEGNGYINVQFVRDVNSDEIFMSPLSYGVMPFNISKKARQAGIELHTPEVLKPGQDLPIHITTDSAQSVVVFAVDEGILQVARYRLKDPLEYFFRKRELSVSSSQILDLILPEFSKIMSLTSAPGGDAGEGMDLHLNPFKRKRDKPVAYWSGIQEIDGEAQLTYPIPDYFNGKIRVMAISVTPHRIGKAQTSTTVRDNFIMTPNVPAMVAPGDEFDVSVGMSNNLENAGREPVAVAVNLSVPPQLEVVGKAKQSLSIAPKNEGMLTFRLRAKSLPGDAPLLFTASWGDKSSRRTISTSVRPAMPYRTQTVMGRMSGSTQTVKNLRTMFDAYAKRDAMLSNSPLVLTNGLAQYLEDYPYYCSEQIISRGIPLVLQTVHPELKTSASQQQVAEQLKGTLRTLRSRQNDNGAIGLWQASPMADAFVTPYAVQFMLQVKEAGFALPSGMLNEANSALRELAASDYYDLYHLRLRAWAIYLLTLQGEVTTNALATVQSLLQSQYPQQWQTDLAALYLASSYKLLKMDGEAEKLLQPSWKALSKAYSKAWWSQNYFDPLVQDSTRLYLITRHFPEKAQSVPPQVLENIVRALKEDRNTTYSSAMSILALGSYTSEVAQQQADPAALAISAVSKNKNLEPEVISSLQGLVAKGSFTRDAQAIEFNNPNDVPAWYVVSQSGYDVKAPKEALSRGLEISRDYTDEKGKPVTQVTLGEKINVHLKIRANSKEGQSNLAIVDLLPGGFEVVQQAAPAPENSDEGEESDGEEEGESHWRSPIAANGSTWQPEYSDVREDRVIIYGSANTEIQEFVYQIKPTNTGSFVIPPAFGEAMYDREVQALTPGKGNIVVVPAEQK